MFIFRNSTSEPKQAISASKYVVVFEKKKKKKKTRISNIVTQNQQKMCSTLIINPGLVYKYWLLIGGMVENYCPEAKFNIGLLFTEARAEVNSRPRLNFTEGTIIFYNSPNKVAVNICFIHPIHRVFLVRTEP